MREFADALIAELEKDYQCYGFGFQVNHVPDVFVPAVMITPNTGPMGLQQGYAIEMKFTFRQPADVPVDKNAHCILFSKKDPLGRVLAGSIRNLRMNMGMEYGINECVYELDFYLGDERRIQELTKAVKHAVWKKYSQDFDSEMDEILTTD